MRWEFPPGLRILRIILYVVLIILINVTAAGLFFRLDLTKSGIYSLAEASRNAVRSLQEPFTIKAYFSRRIPPPYNNTEQLLRDMLEEYALHANRNFHYTITSIDPEADEDDPEARQAALDAQRYGIYPVQVQNIEKDEVKLQNVTMGMVFIHGDLTETIPVLTQTDNLEYRITQMIRRMSVKIGTLLGLRENVQVELYLSSNLFELSAAMGRLPQRLDDIVSELNRENYNRLSYRHRDPYSEPEPAASAQERGVTELTLRRATASGETAESAYAGVVISHGQEHKTVELFGRGLFGDLRLEDEEVLSQRIQEAVERVIGLNQTIGYLSGFGALPLYDQGNTAGINNFRESVSEGYDILEIDPEADIPENVTTLVIAGPADPFSEYALYRIDQFLMKGNSLAVFLDTHREVLDESSQPQGFGRTPRYVPIRSGLEDMLRHYGVEPEPAYVLDENCYRRVQRLSDGNLTEIPFYFYPMIPMERIARDLPFLQNIKGLIMLNVSPLSLTDGDARSTALVSSTEDSWLMRDNINLFNPLMIQPPTNPEERGSRTLAYLLEGEFESYFLGKELPQAPEQAPPGRGEAGPETGAAGAAVSSEEGGADSVGFDERTLSAVESFRRSTRVGKLLVVGTSVVLTDGVMDPDAAGPNSAFVLNLLDYLSGREDYAIMRSKGQRYNPLEEISGSTRNFVKSFNIAGLPILTGAAGLLVWALWSARRRRIQAAFHKEAVRKPAEGGKA